MFNLRKFMKSFLILIVIILILSISKIVGLYTDYLWFDSLGFSKIFTVSLTSKLLIFFFAALFFFIFAVINLWVALKIQKSKLPFKISVLVILFLAFFQGLTASSAWLIVLQYLNQVSFNLQDPILAKDVSFYVFSLPFFLALWKYLFACILLTTLIVAFYYLQQFITSLFTSNVDPNTNTVYKSFNLKQRISKIKRAGMVDMAVLASLIFFLLALKHYLARFSVLYSEKGIVVGAGYTDVFVFLPVVKFLMIFAIIIAALFYVWIFYFSKIQKLGKRHIIAFISTGFMRNFCFISRCY